MNEKGASDGVALCLAYKYGGVVTGGKVLTGWDQN